MATRRIVTEEVDGRSKVSSDVQIESQYWLDELWVTTPDEPMGTDPGMPALNVPAGHSLFRVCHLPPDAVMREAFAAGSGSEVEADGFHRTQTVDYVFVLDGPVELVLDDSSVTVQPGDCVVQRGTNHAWRNFGDQPIRLIAVLTGTH
ncbi:mannose-6-phosphate isomerase-like protein (cupin superfamily) [Paenarthrobacter nitroguajacolicus]|uniref:cupin domain-containing protein n=1 Tax=Paenarthrobacter nitroguajacolicus TaxID=211146 RepID=UPI002856A360|nr:cupin domain-containing protein [Paenarthrobacter nitroguajacolicus]MDR6989203.1 mannose-6-phosphate isomerase-like protein (cupin superfamily) [Paenarthrobacter nitroguajacolicus]